MKNYKITFEHVSLYTSDLEVVKAHLAKGHTVTECPRLKESVTIKAEKRPETREIKSHTFNPFQVKMKVIGDEADQREKYIETIEVEE